MRFIFLSLLLCPAIAFSEGIIRIDNPMEVKNAHKMNTLMQELPLSIVYCLDSSDGNIEECACLEYTDCNKKAALFAAQNHYCKIKNLYPHWVDVSPNYILENDTRGFALHMPSMGTRLGKKVQMKSL